jgi:hypothetical protein
MTAWKRFAPNQMISRITLIKVALVVGAWVVFFYGMRGLMSLQDTSEPPSQIDFVTCERARLNARKILNGQTEFDNVAHRWTIERCREGGFDVGSQQSRLVR